LVDTTPAYPTSERDVVSTEGAVVFVRSKVVKGELWRKLGDDGLRRVAYRGG